MTSDTATCASCGVSGTGRFCSNCGAPRGGPSACRGCGAALAPGARFCPVCGRGVGSAPAAGKAGRAPWIYAGAALVGLLGMVLVVMTRTASAPPQPAESAAVVEADGGAPPDIGRLSPRERFDRLYGRVMRAAQAGDGATVERFTPMALMAYSQLDSVDADTRYRAALLDLHSGDMTGPTALADTILALNPGHLFGYLIRGTVARWRKDDKALARAYAGFLEHYDAELKAGRPEYADHKTALDQFHQQAQQAGAGTAGT